jgi:hypothetical protein
MNSVIIETLRSTPSPRQLAQSIDSLRQFDERELFDTLFFLSVRQQGDGLPVAYAAVALKELNPKCLISPRQALEAVLPEWDISIEEVVFYLMRQFGMNAMRSAQLEIQADSNLASIEEKRLKTVMYWAQIWLEKHQTDQSAKHI